MKKKRRIPWKLIALSFLMGIYPLFVFIYTWTHVFRSELEGGRHGPLDAYRHSLASAVVSYTLNERLVKVTTRLMESGHKNSNRMDGHNNRIGARIGSSSKSFRELEPAVRQVVLDGAVDSSNPNQITWLPKEKWKSGRIW
jgi:hypothetical protein